MSLLPAKRRAMRGRFSRNPACSLVHQGPAHRSLAHRSLAHRQVNAAALCMMLMSMAGAQREDPPRFELSIRAGALDTSLQELARQSGVQVVFFSRIAEGRNAPELSGDYTLAAAMSRLLEGSGLTFRQVTPRTIEVRKGPARTTLPSREPARPASASAAAEGPMQEVQVIATVEQLVATRIPTPLQDIPQSISVISREQIRQQNAFDLSEVLERAPGIVSCHASSLDATAFSRSYEVISFQVDSGGPVKPWITGQVLYHGSPDLSEFDRVEILRGSDALFSGNSSPGGRVVRRAPQRDVPPGCDVLSVADEIAATRGAIIPSHRQPSLPPRAPLASADRAHDREAGCSWCTCV
jgi:hypothetical protein